MTYILIFISELIVLLILSQFITKLLSKIIFFISKSSRVTVYLMAVIFFPGVLIHELSHFFAALILFVPVGGMEFFPKIYGNELKLGSVTIRKTDIIRRTIIGFAPLILGISLLSLSSYIFISLYFKNNLSLSLTTIFIYVVFEVSNTMFSSKKDTEAVMPLLAIAALFLSVIILTTGFSLSKITLLLNSNMLGFFNTIDFLLIIPLIIDLLIYGLGNLLEARKIDTH